MELEGYVGDLSVFLLMSDDWFLYYLPTLMSLATKDLTRANMISGYIVVRIRGYEPMEFPIEQWHSRLSDTTFHQGTKGLDLSALFTGVFPPDMLHEWFFPPESQVTINVNAKLSSREKAIVDELLHYLLKNKE